MKKRILTKKEELHYKIYRLLCIEKFPNPYETATKLVEVIYQQ